MVGTIMIAKDHAQQAKTITMTIFSGKNESNVYTPSSYSSSSSSLSSHLWSCQSPAGAVPSAVGQSAHVAVPFSWEDEPGVPKPNYQVIRRPVIHNRLPRPPPLFSKLSEYPSEKKKVQVRLDQDPFVAALVECTKAAGKDHHDHKPAGNTKNNRTKATSTTIPAGGHCSSSIYSCIKSCSTRESQVLIPRSVMAEKSKLAKPDSIGRPKGQQFSSLFTQKFKHVKPDGDQEYSVDKPGSNDRRGQRFDFSQEKQRHQLYYSVPSKKAEMRVKNIEQKQSTGLMEWVTCTDVELYHSLLQQQQR